MAPERRQQQIGYKSTDRGKRQSEQDQATDALGFIVHHLFIARCLIPYHMYIIRAV
jgi:hypothetical protein